MAVMKSIVQAFEKTGVTRENTVIVSGIDAGAWIPILIPMHFTEHMDEHWHLTGIKLAIPS